MNDLNLPTLDIEDIDIDEIEHLRWTLLRMKAVALFATVLLVLVRAVEE